MNIKRVIAGISAVNMMFAVPIANTFAYERVVYDGDTLWGISQETGFTEEYLMQYNGYTDNTVYAGDTIMIPETDDWYPTQPYYTTTCYENIVTTTVETTTIETTMTETTTVVDIEPIETTIVESEPIQSNRRLVGRRVYYFTPYGNAWENNKIAARYTKSAILNPGDEYSFYWKFPNQASALDGFLTDYAYDENGNLIPIDGGGICRNSTGLYQCAVFDCGMTSVERHDHVKPVSYAIKGEDAAVDLYVDTRYRQDMRFRNDTESTWMFEAKCYETYIDGVYTGVYEVLGYVFE